MKVGRESVRVAVATKTSRSGQRDEGKGRERPVWKKEGKRTHENALVFRERHAVSDRSTTVTLARSGKGKVFCLALALASMPRRRIFHGRTKREPIEFTKTNEGTRP
ncbi:uncharacterized protein LOC143145884 isoform X2 [Ptiloglossa arizonensis]|uniref:uncharacterized protein LOC143145884 isoform X2 n=1 Tax=Ptiloglossa arizonensis TaxID=3350558 RepID=UPI003FA00B12